MGEQGVVHKESDLLFWDGLNWNRSTLWKGSNSHCKELQPHESRHVKWQILNYSKNNIQGPPRRNTTCLCNDVKRCQGIKQRASNLIGKARYVKCKLTAESFLSCQLVWSLSSNGKSTTAIKFSILNNFILINELNFLAKLIQWGKMIFFIKYNCNLSQQLKNIIILISQWLIYSYPNTELYYNCEKRNETEALATSKDWLLFLRTEMYLEVQQEPKKSIAFTTHKDNYPNFGGFLYGLFFFFWTKYHSAISSTLDDFCAASLALCLLVQLFTLPCIAVTKSTSLVCINCSRWSGGWFGVFLNFFRSWVS